MGLLYPWARFSAMTDPFPHEFFCLFGFSWMMPPTSRYREWGCKLWLYRREEPTQDRDAGLLLGGRERGGSCNPHLSRTLVSPLSLFVYPMFFCAPSRKTNSRY